MIDDVVLSKLEEIRASVSDIDKRLAVIETLGKNHEKLETRHDSLEARVRDLENSRAKIVALAAIAALVFSALSKYLIK